MLQIQISRIGSLAFGLTGYGSVILYGSGSGAFHIHGKKFRKTLIAVLSHQTTCQL
jgi:hypothetical protein